MTHEPQNRPEETAPEETAHEETAAAAPAEGQAPPTEEAPKHDQAPDEEIEDLFDLMGASGEQFKKPKKPAPPSATAIATAAKTQPKKTEPKKYPRVPVRYPLLNQTLELPREGMTEDEIHEFLSMEWPELSKEQSRLVHDEKAQPDYIFVVPRGHTKGAEPRTAEQAPTTATPAETSGKPPVVILREPPEDPRSLPLFRLLARDGVYEVRNTVAGAFVVRIGSLAGLRSDAVVREGFSLSAPKIPASLLGEIIQGFRECADEEALVNVMYDRASAEHSLLWPGQARFYATVSAEYTPESPERFVVCQVHSHGLMGAFFSPTDDRDEVRSGVYGVIGDLASPVPEARFRYSCGGLYREVAPTRIFAEEHPGELRQKVRA